MTAKPMIRYDDAHVARLARNRPFREEPVERVCPVCDNQAVRTYVYRSTRKVRPSIVSYTWCAVCRHFIGSTGALLPGYEFDDPFSGLSQEERSRWEGSPTFFEDLDRAWNEGLLPQTFNPAR